MLDRSLVGRESEPVTVEVERGAIRRFAEAIGDQNPIYEDEAAARSAGFAALATPPTFPSVLAGNDRFRQSLGLDPGSFLHGEQSFEYGRPLVAGDRVTVRSRVAEVSERPGPSGPAELLVIEDEGRDASGALLFRARQTLVLRRG
ncbi:MaoC family dehydratase N-terminal domain-containing protein [Anaeromyxobacter paludicola]|uniref:UPF0336 protein n=1 Tax=Anaeromyxobacter paludicola TaxID=2918171 RepID=A0ABN6N839_9BACT|nr:MaoC family dehydratase N-terminal domain-containing protein [Anaeromyxobacter paludicola]BDG09357.1 UPF0336 protein [Anaeromyxobacter paludicola]